MSATPAPGGAQDKRQKQHLKSDADAIKGGPLPGRPCRVEDRERDEERGNDEVREAVDPGGQSHGEAHHHGRNGQGREDGGQQRRTDVELPDEAIEDAVHDAGHVEIQDVDVDVKKHEAGPGGCELCLDRDLRVLERAG